MTDKQLLKKGFWIVISPLANYGGRPSTWILGIYRQKIDKEWTTAHSKDFKCPIEARRFAVEFIKNYKK